jgi:hypothetical protein
VAYVVTPGSSIANGYASVAEMDAHNADYPYASGWFALTQAKKEQYGIRATLGLDTMPEAWTGRATSSAQALGFPRRGMLSRNGFPVGVHVVPAELKAAQSEYARLLMAKDLLGTDSVQQKGIKSLSAESVSITFRDPIAPGDAALPSKRAYAGMVPDIVRLMLPASWLRTVKEQVADEKQGVIFKMV